MVCLPQVMESRETQFAGRACRPHGKDGSKGCNEHGYFGDAIEKDHLHTPLARVVQSVELQRPEQRDLLGSIWFACQAYQRKRKGGCGDPTKRLKILLTWTFPNPSLLMHLTHVASNTRGRKCRGSDEGTADQIVGYLVSSISEMSEEARICGLDTLQTAERRL